MFDLICPPAAQGLRRADAGDGWFSAPWFTNRVKTQAGVIVDEELALTYAPLWAATRALTEPLAMLPLVVTVDQGDGHHIPAVGTPQYDLLRFSPNPLMGAEPFWEGRTMHQVNSGQGFAEIERDALNQPAGLWPIHPSRVRPSQPGERTQAGEPVPDGSYIVKNNGGGHVAILAQDMLHIHGVHSEDGVWGKGIITYARETVGFGVGIERHGATQFGSGNVPRVVLKDGSLKDREKRRQFRHEWKEMHGSPDSGEIVILANKDAAIEPLSFSAVDAQFIETCAFNVQQIATWYGVPLHRLMVKDAGSQGTVEQLGIEYVLYSLLPWSKRQEDQLTLKLFSRADRRRYCVQRKFDAILRAVGLQTRLTAYRVAIMIGVYSVNECRKLEGLPPDPDGDTLFMPANLVSLKNLARGLVQPGTGLGSDASGAPDDGEPNTGTGKLPRDQEQQARAFDTWSRRLGKGPRGELRRQLRRIETLLKAERSHAMLPAPAPSPSPATATTPATPAAHAAARAVLVDVLGRMFSKEAHAALRASRGDDRANFAEGWLPRFYGQKHSATLAGALRPACLALAAAGVPADADGLAVRLAAESRRLLTDAYDRETPAGLAALLEAWPTERARAAADAILAASLAPSPPAAS